jgi:phenylalanyl-tRNA synthetase beta chain
VTDGKNTYNLVCGAANCRPGLITALAVVGSRVLDDEGKLFTIKKSKIRGVESLGMLCATDELGVPNSTGTPAEGIIELPADTPLGIDITSLYSDTVLEISLTPNLGHCTSVIGIARELSAATGRSVKYPWDLHGKKIEESDVPAQITVRVDTPEDCPRYACRVVRDIAVGPSPEWLKKRLELSGIRSINNVVDVTNYVMLELGHPLHAFDYDHLEGHQIIVRHAKAGEHFVTLDSKERVLDGHDLLICDGKKPVAIAGVMGGADSEVKDTTKNILLEAAFFAPGAVRRTSKRLGLMTDASKRFERGCDPNIIHQALDRAAMLIAETSGGVISKGIIDVSSKKFPRKRISCRVNRVNHLLGTKLSSSEIELIFQKLDFIFSWDGQNVFSVDVPTYRNDLQEEIDLVEEVARIYGYDNIDKGSGRANASTLPHAPLFLFEREVRSRLIAEGLQEFLTCDLIGPTLLETLQATELPEKLWVRVLNPVSVEQSILRASLLPGLLQAVKYNWDHDIHDVAGFEVGRIHFKDGEQFREQSMAGIILSGKSRPHHWDVKPGDVDFYDLKGIVENLLNELQVQGISFRKSNLRVLHPGRQASIFAGELEIGSFGEVHPSVQRRLDVPQRIYFAEINLHDLYKVKSGETMMRPLPIFPGSERDLTVTLSEDVAIDQIFKAFRSVRSSFLESITLLDIYRSDKLGHGLKNVTFRFFYRDWEKTISQDKVDAEHARITASINDVAK